MPETRTQMQRLVDEANQALVEARAFMATLDTETRAGTITDARRTELNTSYTTAFNRATDRKSQADRLKTEADLENGLNQLATDPVRLHPDASTQTRAAGAAPGTLTLDSQNADAILGALFGLNSSTTARSGMLQFIRDAELRSADLEQLRRMEPETPEMRGAFDRYLKRPRSTPLQEVEARALTPYVDADGGYIVSRELRTEILRQERDLVQLRRYARVIKTNATSVAIPTFKLNVSLAKTRALGTTTTATIRDILGLQTFVPAEYSKIIRIPQQLVEDTTFPILSLLAEEIALQSSEDEEGLFLTGSGKNEPYGVLTAPILSGDIAGSADAVTPNELKALPYKLRPAFRRRGAWMFERSMLAKVSVMRDDSGATAGTGQYLWQMGLQAGDPDRLVGYPVLESAFFPAAAADGDPITLFGDWLQYWIIDRLALSIQRLDELYAETSEIGFKYRKRFTGAPVRLEAFYRLNRN